MKKSIFHRVRALAFSCALLFAACADEHVRKHDDDVDPARTGEGGADDDDEDGGRARDGGSDAGRPRPLAGDASFDSATVQADAGGGAVAPGNGGMTSQSDGGSSSGAQAEGGGPTQNECAAKAKDECEYQKMCDPVQFAIDWDGDINQFCIPKRKAACEKNIPMSWHRSFGEACNTWVHQSCDNYRNFYYKVLDSAGKWQYGSPACEVTPTVLRENKAAGEDCTADYQCNAGLFCKVASDDYLKHGDPGVESICGKCTPQYAHDGPIVKGGFEDDFDVCYDAEMCKSGYQCRRVYGTDSGQFQSFSFLLRTNADFMFCVKAITKVAMDMNCAKDSNVQCDDGLVCEGATAADTIGKCKVASSATIPTFVPKDARCDPAQCDERLHLECKPVQTGGMTENRCVQKAVSAIGGFCSNDKKEKVAECSQFARCAETSGQCTRRNLEKESCFASVTTPGANDRGSCDANVFDEYPLACRQDSGELATTCHKALLQNMCSVH
jgi:hypothetical protein